MRVALIDPSLFTLPYDAALAGALTDAGQDVTLHGRTLTEQDGGAGRVAIEPSFYRWAGSRAVRRLPKPARLAVKGVDHAVSMLRLRRRLARSRPDVIHFQWLPLPGLDQALLPGFAEIAPVVLTVHDTDPFNGSPTARLQRAGFAASLRRCDRLIVHTRQGVQRLAALGIPASRLCQLPHGPLAEAAAGLADPMQGTLSFVLFGKIKPYKGADLLIEAFAALPEALQAQASVRIVGQPYMDLAMLRSLAAARGVAGRVAIEPRFVADDEIAAVFPPGSVAVFPYREIEASGVLSLALAHGRPVIASRLGSFAETIEDGVHGALLPPGDVPALTAALGAILADRAMAARQADAVRRLTNTLPGWGEIARMTVGVYEAALSDARRRAAPVPLASAREIAS